MLVGAGGAFSLVKTASLTGSFSSGIGGRTTVVLGGAGIFYLYNLLMASPRSF